MSSSSKRSKIVRSSSQGEIGLFSHVQPIEPPATQWVPDRTEYRRRLQEQQAKKPVPSTCTAVERTTTKLTATAGDGGKQSERRSVLTMHSPPPNEEPNGVDECGDFLSRCAWCKLVLNADVFMYGYLGAFCSSKCRNFQIASDGYAIGTALDDTPRAETATVLQKNGGNGKKIRGSGSGGGGGGGVGAGMAR